MAKSMALREKCMYGKKAAPAPKKASKKVAKKAK